MRSYVLISLLLFSSHLWAKPIQCVCFPSQVNKVTQWIRTINKTEIGRNFLNAVKRGERRLQIVHDSSARLSAGKTLIPLTTATGDGRGVNSIQILMDLTMSARGTHLVKGEDFSWISFPAVINLFHEIAHAKHAMTGDTKTMFEIQAIIDENIFRAQLSKVLNQNFSQRLIDGHDASVEL